MNRIQARLTTASDRGLRFRRARRLGAIGALVAALAMFGSLLGVAAALTYVTAWGSQGSGNGQFQSRAS